MGKYETVSTKVWVNIGLQSVLSDLGKLIMRTTSVPSNQPVLAPIFLQVIMGSNTLLFLATAGFLSSVSPGK